MAVTSSSDGLGDKNVEKMLNGGRPRQGKKPRSSPSVDKRYKLERKESEN
jgi:hypothetical protein